MKIKNLLSGVIALGALALGSQAAQAALICNSCEYDDAPAGTHLGAYNPDANDVGTFTHSDLGLHDTGTAFEDFWAFDISPGGEGSISADFTTFTAITGFTGELYADNGSTCAPGTPGTCSDVQLGGLIASAADAGEERWEIMTGELAAGRYIIRVTGTTNDLGTSVYTGQLAFRGVAIPEPGTLALLGLGLLGIGLTAPRRKV